MLDGQFGAAGRAVWGGCGLLCWRRIERCGFPDSCSSIALAAWLLLAWFTPLRCSKTKQYFLYSGATATACTGAHCSTPPMAGHRTSHHSTPTPRLGMHHPASRALASGRGMGDDEVMPNQSHIPVLGRQRGVFCAPQPQAGVTLSCQNCPTSTCTLPWTQSRAAEHSYIG